MMLWANTTYPTGWLLADGSAISRTTYSDLFTAIGTTYGVGDGSTTFNIPSMPSAGTGSPKTIIKVTNSGALEPSAISHAANHTAGGSDVVSITLNQVPSYESYRNLIINGNMSVAQRATSAALGNRTYTTIDRWNLSQDGTANGASSQITTGLPTSFKYGLKIGRNNAATQTGAIVVTQALESVDSYKLRGKQVTLSFYAKKGANYSSASSILNVEVATGTGTDQAASVFYGGWTGSNVLINTSVTLTTGWVYYTVTGTVSATANQIGLDFYYVPVGTAGADDNLYITGVQLEVGSVATPFEFEPFETTLRKCQRYYEKSYNVDVAPGTNTATGAFFVTASTHVDSTIGYMIQFKVTKRVVPDMLGWTDSGTANTFSWSRSGTSGTGGAAFYSTGTSAVDAYVGASVPWVVATIRGHWTASAEL